jgi:hypothetical protein
LRLKKRSAAVNRSHYTQRLAPSKRTLKKKAPKNSDSQNHESFGDFFPSFEAGYEFGTVTCTWLEYLLSFPRLLTAVVI